MYKSVVNSSILSLFLLINKSLNKINIPKLKKENKKILKLIF